MLKQAINHEDSPMITENPFSEHDIATAAAQGFRDGVRHAQEQQAVYSAHDMATASADGFRAGRAVEST